MNESADQLLKLYANTSKHSAYQVLTPRLRALLPPDKIAVRSRSEEERWRFMASHIDFTRREVLEVGGNTGFFTFGALEAGARHVTFIEGNHEHAEFVRLAAKLLGFDQKLTVENRYYTFDEEEHARKPDVGIVLNVVHHLGDDFGDQKIGLERAKERMLFCLNSLAPRVSQLAFQMGFCWKGNRALGLFPNGRKKEMIDFIAQGTENFWDISAIGIPEVVEGAVRYAPPNESNLQRHDKLGEFLNRPLFILRSKRNASRV